MNKKLYELIAVERDLARAAAEVREDAASLFDVSDQFLGMLTEFEKVYDDDDGRVPDLPNEEKALPYKVKEVLEDVAQSSIDFINVTVAKEMANASASAELLIGDARMTLSATALLNLEARLQELRVVVEAIPTLMKSETWELDEHQDCFVSKQRLQTRTVKMQKPIVLYEATPEHPAQTQMITDDVPAYTVKRVIYSGMLPETEKRAMLARLERLQIDVKQARQRANATEASPTDVGEHILKHVFG